MFINDKSIEYIYRETAEYFYEFLPLDGQSSFEPGLKHKLDKDVTPDQLLTDVRNSLLRIIGDRPYKITICRREQGTRYCQNAYHFTKIRSLIYPNLPLYLVASSFIDRMCKPGEKISGFINVSSKENGFLEVTFRGRKYFK